MSGRRGNLKADATDGPLVLGVDGGRSKTIALVADMQGRIVGAGRAGDPTVPTTDAEHVLASVVAAIRQARRSSPTIVPQLSAMGLAGVDWPDDSPARIRALSRLGVDGPMVVTNDVFLGWHSAWDRGPFGVVVAAGTGAQVGVITPDGEEWHYGAYARSGGAQEVAMRAIEATYAAQDGRGAPTRLTEVVLRHLGLDHPDELLQLDSHNRLSLPRVFALAPMVFETAARGDTVAQRIVTEQAAVLAEYATAAIRRFGMTDLRFSVVVTGGLFRTSNSTLRQTFESEIRAVAPHVRFAYPTLEPAIGAILLCYARLQIATTEAIVRNLAASCPPSEFFETGAIASSP